MDHNLLIKSHLEIVAVKEAEIEKLKREKEDLAEKLKRLELASESNNNLEKIWTAIHGLQTGVNALLSQAHKNQENSEISLADVSFPGTVDTVKPEPHPDIERTPLKPDHENTILIFGGFARKGNTRVAVEMSAWNRDALEWNPLKMEPMLISENDGVVYLNEEIYVIKQKSFYKMDKNCNWIQLQQQPVHEITGITNSCLEWKGTIWIFGGLLDSYCSEMFSVTNDCLRYYPSQNEWIRMTPMNYRRYDAAATVFNDKIFVCGGRNYEHNPVAAVEWFDSKSGIWTDLTFLPTPLYGHSLMVYENQLIMAGGYDYNNTAVTTLRMINPIEGTTETMPPMKYATSNFAGVTLGNEIFAIGGYRNGNAPLDKVEIFNGKEWRDGPSPPFMIGRSPAVIVPQTYVDHLLSLQKK